MAQVSTYLNFPRSTEEAFSFYKQVFGTEFVAPIMRFRDMPPDPNQPPLSDEDSALVMHVALPILGGHMIMGTDAPESMGFQLVHGNAMYINLQPDDRADTERLFGALSEGGKVETPLQDMPWGGYFGSISDRFGVHWMFIHESKS